MDSYLVTLDFVVAYGQCDLTLDQTPPGTPEGIVAQVGTISLVLVSEGSEQMRRYHVEILIEASTSGDSAKDVIGLFDHLPGYETLTVDVADAPGAHVAPEPASLAERQAAASESGPTGPFRVQCLFRSVLPFDRLQAFFTEHVAGGNLVSNAHRHNEYVALVDFEAVSAEGLEDATHFLLARAFGADTEESADNFQPITTRLL